MLAARTDDRRPSEQPPDRSVEEPLEGLLRHVREALPDRLGQDGKVLLCCTLRPEIEVFWIETPVKLESEFPLRDLHRFVERVIEAKGDPTAREIATFLNLPTRIVELVLRELTAARRVSVDALERWHHIGDKATAESNGAVARVEITRRLLCYWRAADVLLPVIPLALRQRDLAPLCSHHLTAEVLNVYERIGGWDRVEGERRGKPANLTLTGIISKADEPPPRLREGALISAPSVAAASIRPDSVLVKSSRLDVFCLTYAKRSSDGVWDVESRFHSRLRGLPDDLDVTFAPGNTIRKLPVLETFIEHGSPGSEDSRKKLGTLFNHTVEDWKYLIAPDLDRDALRRNLVNPQGCLLEGPLENTQATPWTLVDTTMGSHFKLVSRTAYEH